MEMLTGMAKKRYNELKASGMFWEYYPQATGSYEKDVELKDQPQELEENGRYICPHCSKEHVAHSFKFCPDCGKEIHWTEDI